MPGTIEELKGLTIPDWVNEVWRRSKGKAWEPPRPDSNGVRWLIDNGFAKRVDGRCGFEAFKDSMLQWTLAGRAALDRSSKEDGR